MKVVQINAVYGFSSVGRTMTEMHEYFISHSIESYVFYSVKTDKSREYDLIGNELDHKIHGFFSRLLGKQAYFSWLPTKHLIRKLKQIGPDAVILRNFHSNYIHMPLLFKYLAKEDIKTIVVLHDCWFYTGHCCHYTEVGCFKWQAECNHCPLIHTNNKSWFFDNSNKLFRDKKRLFGAIRHLKVVGVSDWITNEAKKAPIFSKAEVFQRIYNWIDLNKFYYRDGAVALRKKMGLSSSDFVALGVSMLWDDRKGLDVICKLADILTDIKIVLIGQLPEKEYPTNIISVPPTNSTDELAEYYSLADVFLNFSIQESFGKVSAEALACGTPLIVNNATANPEIPGECGFVVETANIDTVVEAVENVRSRGKLSYHELCMKRANELFNKDENIKQYLSLLQG